MEAEGEHLLLVIWVLASLDILSPIVIVLRHNLGRPNDHSFLLGTTISEGHPVTNLEILSVAHDFMSDVRSDGPWLL